MYSFRQLQKTNHFVPFKQSCQKYILDIFYAIKQRRVYASTTKDFCMNN